MKRVLFCAAAVSITIAAFLPPPASAAETKWSDPEGDATGIGLVLSTPRPSEPEFDILETSVSIDGDKLVYQTRLAALGDPPLAAIGYYVRMYFGYEGVTYEFELSRDVATGESVFFTSNAQTEVDDPYTCTCVAKWEHSKGLITLTAGLSALKTATKTAGASKPAEAGATLTDLRVLVQRTTGLVTLSVDDSATDQPFTL